jgi:hypothetical protein
VRFLPVPTPEWVPEINEFPFHSRANQSTIAVIIQADAMNRLQVVSGSIDYIEQFEGSAA